MVKNNDVIGFHLWNASGEIIASHGEIDKLSPSFRLRFSENFHEGELRNIYRKTDEGAVQIIAGENSLLFQGNKSITRTCSVYLSFIPYFKQIRTSNRQHFDSIIRRFAHNLIKFQTRFKGNFARLISDTARERTFAEFQEEVKRRIESNTNIAAQDVCQMSHRAVDLDAQIETLRIISGYADSPSKNNKIKVNLQKTIFRLVNPFVEELRGRKIEVEVIIPPVVSGDDKVFVDPGLFNAAIWQLLDNASKYVLEGTNISISATLNSNPKKLELEMISVCIDTDELESIFLEGTKGRHSGKKGESGIGLFIVRKVLNLMGSKIHVQNQGFEKDNDGFPYCKHRFIIEFGNQ